MELTYTNNPNVKTDGETGDNSNPDKPDLDDPVGVTPESKVKTFTTEIELEKVDGSDNTKKLKDVEFQIIGEKLNVSLGNNECFIRDDSNGTYYLLKDGTYTETAPTDDTKAKYVSESVKYKKETNSTTYNSLEKVTAYGKTDENGKLKFSGLAEGTYYIKEMITNTGYNLLTDPIVIQISGTVAQDNESITWSYKKDGGTASATNTFNIENNKGATLPSTGGIGTTIFYVSGGVLILGAGVVLITKKRMSLKDDK